MKGPGQSSPQRLTTGGWAQLLECPLPRFKCPARIEATTNSVRNLVRFPQLKIDGGVSPARSAGWLAAELSIELTEAAVAGERDDRLKFPLDSQHIALVLSTAQPRTGVSEGSWSVMSTCQSVEPPRP